MAVSRNHKYDLTVAFFLHGKTICNLMQCKDLVVHRENFLIPGMEVLMEDSKS